METRSRLRVLDALRNLAARRCPQALRARAWLAYLTLAGLLALAAVASAASAVAAREGQAKAEAAGMVALDGGWSQESRVQSSTIVPGGAIATDTVWGQAGSPYIVQGSLVVGAGVTLTVESGVEVRFANGVWMVAASGATLLARGLITQPITFTSVLSSPMPGAWLYLQLQGGSKADLDYVDLGYAGAGGNAALDIQSSDVQVRNSRIHHGGTDGVFLQGEGIRPLLENVVVADNRGAAIYQNGLSFSPTYRNLTLVGNGTDAAVVLWSYPLPQLTFDGGGGLNGRPFIVTSNGSIVAGSVVTVTPGTELRFGNWLAVDAGGRLVAEGTAAQPITFTASVTNPQPGSWQGLNINGQARLDHVDLGYGGNEGLAALYLNYADAQVRNSRIHHSASDGVRVEGENISPWLENVVVENSAGVAVKQSGPNMSPTYRNLRFSGNGTNAVQMSPGSVQGRKSWLFGRAGVPIQITAGVSIGGQGSSLYLEPGTTLHFGNDSFLAAEGALYALGTAAAPITFTSVVDQPGSWRGLFVNPGGMAILQHCEIARGGGRGDALLSLGPGQAVVQNCRVHDGAADGIRVSGGLPVLAFNQIYGNATFGISNTTAITVDARSTWWGDPSGPYHPTLNPSGKGNAVGNRVLFDPWLASPPTSTTPIDRVFVGLAGPGRASPGQTVDYAIEYVNPTATTVENAVLVFALPDTADYVGSTGDGIHWPEQYQVFWKLGNLAPAANGFVSVRVRFHWGLPSGLQDGTLALLGGTNLEQTALEVAPYLAYSPVVVLATMLLTEAEVEAERRSSADLDRLYARAIADGFTAGSAARLSLSTGAPITVATLLDPNHGAVRLLRREAGQVTVATLTGSSYSLESPTGGITAGLLLPALDLWGDVAAPGGSLSLEVAATPTYGQCMQNCLAENLPLDLLGDKYASVNNLFAGVDCFACFGPGSGSDPNRKQRCEKCFAGVLSAFTGIPGVGASVSYKQCNEDCQRPESHVCRKDIIFCPKGKTIWDYLPIKPSAFYLVMFCDQKTQTYQGFYNCNCPPDPVTVPGVTAKAKCVKGVGCRYCAEGKTWDWQCGLSALRPATSDASPDAGMPSSPPAAPPAAAVAWRGQFITSSGLCRALTGSGVGADCENTEIQPARDPNAMYGPEGDLLPGQLVTYSITYENEGAGRAYGVFVTDQLGEQMDAATLKIYGGGEYMEAARTIIWQVGELAPKGEGGSSGVMSFTVRLQNNLPGGTVVVNQGVVYFPSVPEVTPTNPVVNVVRPVVALPQSLRVPAGQSVAVALQGKDVAGAPLTYAVVEGPLMGDLVGAAPTLVYAASLNFSGQDIFSFKVSNGVTESRPAEVQIIVGPSAADNVPPQVRWTVPASGTILSGIDATPVYTDARGSVYRPPLAIQTTEAISSTSLTTETVRMTVGSGSPMKIDVTWDGTTNRVIILPRVPLQPGLQYSVTVDRRVSDLIGNQMAADYTWSFRTASAPSAQSRIYVPVIMKGLAGGW